MSTDQEPRELERRRPDGVDDATVEAMGAIGDAMESIERARGRLYDFHQLMGHSDLGIGEAAEKLRAAGHAELADRVERELVGLNVLPGRWTFQLVEEFDDGYYATAKAIDRDLRDALLAGRRHVFEAEMKARRRTRGRSGHEATPRDA